MSILKAMAVPILLVLMLGVSISFIIREARYEKYNNYGDYKDSISVFVLNYKRPRNIKKLLKRINNYKEVGEIIISNGHPDFVFTDEHKKYQKLKIYDDFNNEMGPGKRFTEANKYCTKDSKYRNPM